MSDPQELSLARSRPEPGSACLALHGALDHATADALTAAVREVLRDADGVRELRLDCDGLRFCDSSGLSALLMVRRWAGAAGIALHLDNRGAGLDRLLRVTHTLAHLTGAAGGAREEQLDR